jgi:hypothetical protein
MNQAWPRLRVGGLMLVDDVNNQSFRDFVTHSQPTTSAVCRSADGTWMFGVARKGVDLVLSPQPQPSAPTGQGMSP